MALRVLGEELFFDLLCAFSDGLLLRAFQLNQGIYVQVTRGASANGLLEKFYKVGDRSAFELHEIVKRNNQPQFLSSAKRTSLGVPIPLHRIPAT